MAPRIYQGFATAFSRRQRASVSMLMILKPNNQSCVGGLRSLRVKSRVLDIAIVNAFLIYASNPQQPWGPNRRGHLHRQFRKELAYGLFRHSKQENRPISSTKPLAEYVHPAQKQEHQLVRLTDKAAPCKACVSAGRKATRHATMRKPLGELSTNTTKRAKLPPKRPERPPRSRFGCALYNINLCEHKRCWSDHIRVIQ